MSALTYILAGWAIIAIVFYAYGREKTWTLFYGSADLGAIDFANFTPSKKPNHAFFCPENFCPNAKRKTISPIFSLSTEELKNKLFKLILAEPRMVQVADDNENLEYRFVHHTRLMRYPDTIRIKLISLEDGKSTLAMFSESQIGYGDQGVNYKRLNRWVRLLEVD